MPALKTTSPIAPDLTQSFNDEWQSANDNYLKGIRGGYSPEDAQKLFLQPTIQKWDIIKSSPSLQQDRNRLRAFNQEFDDSANAFHRNFNEYSRDGGNAAYANTLQPTLAKWGIEGSLPRPALISPSAEAGYLKRVSKGESPLDIVSENPNLLNDSQSRTTWNVLLRNAIRGESKSSVTEDTDKKIAEKNYSDAVTGNGVDSDEAKRARNILENFNNGGNRTLKPTIPDPIPETFSQKHPTLYKAFTLGLGTPDAPRSEPEQQPFVSPIQLGQPQSAPALQPSFVPPQRPAPSGFIGTPGGVNQFDPNARANGTVQPSAAPSLAQAEAQPARQDLSKGTRVRNKKTGATGIQLPSGEVIPD